MVKKRANFHVQIFQSKLTSGNENKFHMEYWQFRNSKKNVSEIFKKGEVQKRDKKWNGYHTLKTKGKTR